MKPYLTDASFGALTHEFDRDIWVRCNDEAIELAGNAGEIGIAASPLNFNSFWIDRENFEPRGAQLAIDGVGGLARLARNTCNSEAFAAKECSNRVG